MSRIKVILLSTLAAQILWASWPLSASLAEPVNNLKLWIFKGNRELWLIKKGKVKKIYQVCLGKNPTGSKKRKGDNRTPEGEYFISLKKKNSRFHRFLGISYPNMADADNALERKLITIKQWADIWFALQTTQIPPPNTPLGGQIGIHGQGARGRRTNGMLSEIDWTEGCIAVTNAEIEELYRVVPLRTPVKIWR